MCAHISHNQYNTKITVIQNGTKLILYKTNELHISFASPFFDDMV